MRDDINSGVINDPICGNDALMNESINLLKLNILDCHLEIKLKEIYVNEDVKMKDVSDSDSEYSKKVNENIYIMDH